MIITHVEKEDYKKPFREMQLAGYEWNYNIQYWLWEIEIAYEDANYLVYSRAESAWGEEKEIEKIHGLWYVREINEDFELEETDLESKEKSIIFRQATKIIWKKFLDNGFTDHESYEIDDYDDFQAIMRGDNF